MSKDARRGAVPDAGSVSGDAAPENPSAMETNSSQHSDTDKHLDKHMTKKRRKKCSQNTMSNCLLVPNKAGQVDPSIHRSAHVVMCTPSTTKKYKTDTPV